MVPEPAAHVPVAELQNCLAVLHATTLFRRAVTVPRLVVLRFAVRSGAEAMHAPVAWL